ncbi:MAG: hypothetical protein IKU80_04000 [Firmicutes bacterium]|nr:hypothetical protein [Bacillota bacterium]
MKILFTEDDIKNEVNKIYIEDDDVLLEGEFITGEGLEYVITGSAIIEGEKYHDFQVQFVLLEEPAEETAKAIMEMEWDWYDYLC